MKTRFFPTATLAAELDEAWRQSVGNVGKPGGNLGTDGTFLHPQCGGSHVRTALQFVRIFILSYQLTFDDFHARVFDDSGASPNHSKVPDERPPRRHSPPFKPFRIVRIIALPDASLTQTDLSGNGCRLRRSMQHLHEVYSPESENLKSVWGVDSSAVRPD